LFLFAAIHLVQMATRRIGNPSTRSSFSSNKVPAEMVEAILTC
jgi:hypothetical protein